MRTKLSVAIALAGTLLATCLVSGSAKATSVPVLKVEGSSGIVTLVGRGGRGGGRHYGGGGRHYGGGGGHRNYGYRGGGRNTIAITDIATMAIVTTAMAIVTMAIAVIEAVAGMADAGGAMA